MIVTRWFLFIITVLYPIFLDEYHENAKKKLRTKFPDISIPSIGDGACGICYILTFIHVCLTIYYIHSDDFFSSKIVLFYISTIAVVISSIFYHKQLITFKKEVDEIWSKKDSISRKIRGELNELNFRIGGTAIDKFFVECTLQDINFNIEKDSERAKLIADKFSLSYTGGIKELYDTAWKAHIKITEKHIELKRKTEKYRYDELNKYSKYTGKEKRLSMLTDMLDKLKTADNSARQLMWLTAASAHTMKERNSATRGGIANGLGGPAAGISTYLETEKENQQIREYNKANQKAVSQWSYDTFDPLLMENAGNKIKLEEQISTLKSMLKCEDKNNSFINSINFKKTHVEVSCTGNFIITSNAQLDKNFRIYDDLPACIDGVINANIYCDDSLIASTIITLPLMGIGYKETPIVGICINPIGEMNKKYTVKFESKNICAIENHI